MFVYEKKLQYPVRIKNTNPKLASIIISQYGGPNGELGAALLIGSTFPGAKAAQRCGRQTACLRQLLCGTVCQLHPFVESL